MFKYDIYNIFINNILYNIIKIKYNMNIIIYNYNIYNNINNILLYNIYYYIIELINIIIILII